MARYVLHTANPDGPTPDELALIRERGPILNQSRRALLVELTREQATELGASLQGWTVQPEIRYPIPTTRRKLK
ncbi:hypothetical protein FAES_3049 [Fibrella aestuarina BUZ 2]|uniref:Uncharacterized protein n=1 Tax=Fibrella aestuarina BUZ 2 TaxID=1166018 RepID=I0KAA5_9BACT|nr:hypothetical protein [Fibrella aestuarina]CCH01058.1 hypothetical protein FAES_3049 [Fibrella aestuarina BUZ 2]